MYVSALSQTHIQIYKDGMSKVKHDVFPVYLQTYSLSLQGQSSTTSRFVYYSYS